MDAEFLANEGRRINQEDWERVMGVRPGMNEAEKRQVIAETAEFLRRDFQRVSSQPLSPVNLEAKLRVVDRGAALNIRDLLGGNVVSLPVGKRIA